MLKMRDENEIKIQQLEAAVAFLQETTKKQEVELATAERLFKKQEVELATAERLFKNANRNHGKWKNRALTAEADLKSLLDNSVQTRRLMFIDQDGYMCESSHTEEELPSKGMLDDHNYFLIDTIDLESKMTTRYI